MNHEKIELYFSNEAKLYAEANSDYEKMINFFVESYGYKGYGYIYLDDGKIKKYISELIQMSKLLTGECRITDNESLSFINLSFKEDGLNVNGRLGDYVDHTLFFEFKADQTIINPLVNLLKIL